jgi:methyl coenzyme M reductase alpha subunit
MLTLNDEDLELLDEALDDAIEVAEAVLESHIESDQTPETIEEFMAVVSTAQDRLDRLRVLQEEVRRA